MISVKSFFGAKRGMFYVYLLENQNDKSWYIGFTANLKERFKQHQSGEGARTTLRKPGWKIIYSEIYISKEDAVGREKFLKSGSGRKYLKKQLNHYLLGQ